MGARELIDEFEYFLDARADVVGTDAKAPQRGSRRPKLSPWRASSVAVGARPTLRRLESTLSSTRSLVRSSSAQGAEGNRSASEAVDTKVEGGKVAGSKLRGVAATATLATRLVRLPIGRRAALRRQRWRDAAVTVAPSEVPMASISEGKTPDGHVRRHAPVLGNAKRPWATGRGLKPRLRRSRASVSSIQSIRSVVFRAVQRRTPQREQSHRIARKLRVTRKLDDLIHCERMLLYLNGLTWTSGEETAALAAEVAQALALGIPVQLAHEMVGEGGQEARHGCEFGSFFACERGATPSILLRAGIYGPIASPLKGGEWREVTPRAHHRRRSPVDPPLDLHRLPWCTLSVPAVCVRCLCTSVPTAPHLALDR